jgi:hypothetical protein
VANPQRKRLGEVLLEAGVIDGTQLQAALGHQRRWGGRIGQALVDLKMATEEQIVGVLATKLGFPRVELEGIEYGPGLELALRLVPHEFSERNQLLPYAADPTYLWVAMADPTNVGVIDELAFRTGRHVKISIAGDREIARAVRRLYLGDKRGIEAIALDEGDLGPVEMVGPLEPGAGTGMDDYFTGADFAPGGKAAAPTAATPQPPPPGAPPPLPVRPGAPPPPVLGSGPEMRLAAAVRGLRMSGPEAAAEPVMTPDPDPAPTPPPVAQFVARPGPPAATALPSGPPELIIDVQPEGEPEYGPRVEALLDSLERIGVREPAGPEMVRLARLSSTLIRLLLRKGVVTESELADAFVRGDRGPPRR